MTNSIAWFEVPPRTQSERASSMRGCSVRRFESFGDDDYHVASEAGGAVQAAPGENGLLAYFSVDDIDAAVARVLDLGGEVGQQQEVAGIGRYAHCSDSEGNRFGLYDGASQ